MSTLVPSILQTHTPFPYPILSAFPVHFPAFPHKRNNNIILPAAKKRTKPERNTFLSRSFAVRIHKGANILPPNSLSAHKRRNKGITICPSYYVSVSERDNIMSPHFYCVSPRISQEGQYIAPLIHFPSFI